MNTNKDLLTVFTEGREFNEYFPPLKPVKLQDPRRQIYEPIF